MAVKVYRSTPDNKAVIVLTDVSEKSYPEGLRLSRSANSGDISATGGGETFSLGSLSNILDFSNNPYTDFRMLVDVCAGSSGAGGGASPTPSLQQTTDIGNTTTNSIIVNDINGAGAEIIINQTDVGAGIDNQVRLEGGFLLLRDNTNNNFTLISANGFQITRAGQSMTFGILPMTANRNQTLQDADGVIALLSNILPTVLTGFNILGGSISATDTILQAFGKAQNQINGILGNTQINENASIIPTAASTTTLTIASNTKQIFTGSVFGKVLNLGNATTYVVGKSWFLKSNASQTISIVNNGNTEIYRLEPQCSLEVTLQDNTTANGVWIFNVQYPCSERMIGYNDSFLAGTSAGQTNFAITSSGAGAGATLTTTIKGKNGAITLSTGTTATGRTCPNKNNNGILFGTGVCVLVQNIHFEDLSTATDRYVFYSGFGDNTAAGDMIDGVYFEYSEGANGNFWVLKTANNSVRSTVVTAIPVVADTWYELKTEVNELGTRADFFVNDVNVGNITNNIPTALGRNTGILQKIEKTVGGIARLAYTNLSNFRNYPNQ